MTTIQGKVGKARVRGKATIDGHRQHTSDWARLGYFFIEVFSGSEVVARQLRARGFKVYTFDKMQGESGDLLKRAVMNRVLRLVSSGMCLGVFAGIECTSFSICHANQLRTKLFPAGRPDLEGKQRDKVRLGNLLFRAGMRILNSCVRVGVPFAWENPASSFMWQMPASKQLEKHEGVQDCVFDACAYGAVWKKPTRLRCFLLKPGHMGMRCKQLGRLCGFSLRPHVQLQGRDPTGVNWTARASEYPHSLAVAIAKLLVEGASDRVFAHRVSEILLR